MKKTLKIIVFLFFLLFILKIESIASNQLIGVENFPESYKPYLYELKKKHPNWQFTALYTNLDWNTCINEEYKNDKNLVPISYQDSWKCTDSDIYNVEIDAGWVNSSKQAIEYTMDPRNFLNEVRIFQFEKLTYDPNVNTKEGIEKILYGTEFYNKIVTYKEANGAEITTNSKYSDIIWDAAVYSGVSPYHLASRIKQEVGPFLSHNSISGTVSGFEGLYNFYNIGATSSSEYLGAIKNGLQYAKNGKGSLSNEEMQNQLLPWNTKEKAIKGGAVFIGKSYILAGQNTVFLQKFNVNDNSTNSLFWHQYMTNCLAPYSESKSIYTAYQSSGLLDSSIGFLIPIFNNMPQYSTNSPSILQSDYENDNTKVYAEVSGNLNVRAGPSTSYEILTTVNRNDKFTRIKRGIQNGERWDKVVLENGIVGYVFQSYLREVPENIEVQDIIISNEEVNLQVNDVVKLYASVTPENATDKDILWFSENDKIAKVDENGTVTGVSDGTTNIVVKTKNGLIQKKCKVNVIKVQQGVLVEFDNSLKIQADEISNLNLEYHSVRDILNLINTNMNLEILKYDNTKLEENDLVGTGSKLIIINNNNDIVYEYKFIIYGDVNGDGNINSLDVLVLQKHILEIKPLKDEFLKAGNIARNGNMPSSLDVLKIQKHILEIKYIEQGESLNNIRTMNIPQKEEVNEYNNIENMEKTDNNAGNIVINNTKNDEENDNLNQVIDNGNEENGNLNQAVDNIINDEKNNNSNQIINNEKEAEEDTENEENNIDENNETNIEKKLENNNDNINTEIIEKNEVTE